ncbi:hypothetical protein [Sporomusa acidovorans]|uniref:Uncharacterized protein n=1 Tax=Sporomusa acidovorans (strain ATCC 49682 / DSM 3132 / Mol) TaxID=1123286 RepID=A0ABZ3J4M6_SPOA4|nr:hypothetical protein [Sporomusa acidovorans]OZC23122.1 hypothetical protein SPACI_09540 [Sporomusa acidovorans DSM 3132]SDF06093.1 hypothetical protein SAMN04488499_103158 [Sporomusa acidovorans]
MDSLIPLLLMLLLYLVPELLKRRKEPKKYEYPDIPDKIPQPVGMQSTKNEPKPVAEPIMDFSADASNNWNIAQKQAVVMPAPVAIPQTTEPVSPWQGKLSWQMVQNGLIFSEIIQPPRAYRPIWRHRK